MRRYAFEDFTPGTALELGEVAVTRDAIVAFAREWDPQPFHTDEAAAEAGPVGGLIASGWHTASLNMRLLVDGLLADSTSLGAPGIEELRWLAPVRPGDRLRSVLGVVEVKASRSRPAMGLVRCRLEVSNQDGVPVMTQAGWIMFGRRGARADDGAGSAAPPAPAAPHGEPDPAPDGGAALPFDDLAVGQVTDLGAHAFTAPEIVRFAGAFDPQPFHLDEEAAARTHFGGLSASGWHTAVGWMRRMILTRDAAAKALREQGREPARFGPSPGFRDLRWVRPVRAGDTVRYRSALVDKRLSASRPGWGLVFHDNTGVNGRGEPVFAFRSCVLWGR